jgi:hypothetical protein
LSLTEYALNLHHTKLSNDSILSSQQITGIIEYIPSFEETKSLQNYINNGNDVNLLCECEKFMIAIMSIQEAKKKMEAMLFKLHYPATVKELKSGTFH